MLFASIVNLICVNVLDGSDQVHHVSTLLGLEVIPDSLPVLAALLIRRSVTTIFLWQITDLVGYGQASLGPHPDLPVARHVLVNPQFEESDDSLGVIV